MSSRFIGLERALLALFVASGFAGLVYQAIWSHYLGLSLGHAAYAQTLVLAIFMGGMALGAWLVSRLGLGWRRLILAYAVVEVVVGLAGLAFHPVFEAYTGFSQGTVYPALESGWAIRAWQWGSAALLIAPQSILLGMTFPLMSGGYLRVAPRADGEILGGLYFTNSIGAAFGALFATFVLLPWVGMPGAVAAAGAVNLAVGVLAWVVSRRADAQPLPASATSAPDKPAPAMGKGFYRVILLAAGITGASSFVYEIGWVRLLNQALGTTVHSFELMLSAFILGLAFGGLWIRRRSHAIHDAVGYAGRAQIWMGVAALLSLPVFAQSFRWVGALMGVLERDAGGYTLFSLGSGVIALLVMFPAAFFAGMTLPLLTMALLRRGGGEASIGRVYAANTLGAIIGVALAVHVLIPMLGVQLAVTLAALVDIVLGFVLLRMAAAGAPAKAARYPVLAAISVGVLALSLVTGRMDPRTQVSGVFRHGRASLEDSAQVVYLRDGKTSTVSVYLQGSAATIATNGKSDATLELDINRPALPDEITMLMAAALPLAIHPKPESIAVIGWGSGLTTHTLLGSPVPTQVDSIEIERAMHVGARQFGERVRLAYDDPRSVLHVDDARTFFSSGKRKFDVIVSEPSNPWVSGVASLFTKEFYRFLRGHLNEGGIGIQWLQSYELDDPLLMTMVSALIEEFPYVDAYVTNSADLLFVVSASPLPPIDYSRIAGPGIGAEMARVGLANGGDMHVRRILSRRSLAAMVALTGATPHSDFYPTVALEAPRARFIGKTATSLQLLLMAGMPVLDVVDDRKPPAIADEVSDTPTSLASELHWLARDLRTAMAGGGVESLARRDGRLAAGASRLLALSAAPVQDKDLQEWLGSVALAADNSLSYLPAVDHEGIWINPAWIAQDQQPEAVRRVLAAYDAAARRDGPAMSATGLAALEVLDPAAPEIVREHMLVIASLGAIAEGRPGDVLALERGPGANVVVGPHYGLVRSFLLAWADENP
ncbi:MAG: spermine synthase [Arenimonas sp.]|nr:spermine synthase [Arenimonas sp.]